MIERCILCLDVFFMLCRSLIILFQIDLDPAHPNASSPLPWSLSHIPSQVHPSHSTNAPAIWVAHHTSLYPSLIISAQKDVLNRATKDLHSIDSTRNPQPFQIKAINHFANRSYSPFLQRQLKMNVAPTKRNIGFLLCNQVQHIKMLTRGNLAVNIYPSIFILTHIPSHLNQQLFDLLFQNMTINHNFI